MTNENNDDQELADRISQGDSSALSEVLRRHIGKVKACLIKRFTDELQPHERDEVLTAAVQKVWEEAGTFESWRGSLGGWFLKIAIHEAIDLIRRGKAHRRRYKSLPDDYDPSDEFLGDEPLPTDEVAVRRLELVNWYIDNSLAGLEQAIMQADRAAGGDADVDRLAENLGKTKNNIYATRSKARKKIREWVLVEEANDQQEDL